MPGLEADGTTLSRELHLLLCGAPLAGMPTVLPEYVTLPMVVYNAATASVWLIMITGLAFKMWIAVCNERNQLTQ